MGLSGQLQYGLRTSAALPARLPEAELLAPLAAERRAPAPLLPALRQQRQHRHPALDVCARLCRPTSVTRYKLRYRLTAAPCTPLMYETQPGRYAGMAPAGPASSRTIPTCYTDKNLDLHVRPRASWWQTWWKRVPTTRTVYLPAGCKWYDCERQAARATRAARPSRSRSLMASIPMFLRGSAIVATSEDVKHILRDTMHQLRPAGRGRDRHQLCAV